MADRVSSGLVDPAGDLETTNGAAAGRAARSKKTTNGRGVGRGRRATPARRRVGGGPRTVAGQRAKPGARGKKKRGRARKHRCPQGERLARASMDVCDGCAEFVARFDALLAKEKELARVQDALTAARAHASATEADLREDKAELERELRASVEAQNAAAAAQEKSMLARKGLEASLEETRARVEELEDLVLELQTKTAEAEASAGAHWSKLVQTNQARDELKNELRAQKKECAELSQLLRAAQESTAQWQQKCAELEAQASQMASEAVTMANRLEEERSRRKVAAEAHAREMRRLRSAHVRKMMYRTASTYSVPPSEERSVSFDVAFGRLDPPRAGFAVGFDDDGDEEATVDFGVDDQSGLPTQRFAFSDIIDNCNDEDEWGAVARAVQRQ